MLGLTAVEHRVTRDLLMPHDARERGPTNFEEQRALRRLLYVGRIAESSDLCPLCGRPRIVVTSLGLEAKRIHEAILATEVAAA